MQEPDFQTTLDRIIAKDPRYHRDAYLFVREALDYTQKTVAKNSPRTPHHVTGQELLEGIRQYALGQFGPLTTVVLETWGVSRCEDFGEIVFNLVDCQLLSKTEQDSRNDFKGVYDFYTAFREPFLPAGKRRKPVPPPPASP
ncbi:MAG TPA: hypothetical protein P5555_05370 [Candidatus Paceibacterota bacterium]|nr:hypothetical protein [Verrucomicrobiota bacterium]HOX01925.1 hypothetical protein [Verrucomicrobiota bacterium]HRZ44601.1 hypothetical protein [Candidatus Paceibacterota bacterium]HRZ94587.1 hypothetical protein [Candidatus Paceibacterota bacterium]